MPFVSPLALVGLVGAPLIVAFYLLKLRREERVIPSTLLWHRLVADVEANAPWQRLRRSLLLLLQVLLAIALALLAARPFLERPAGLARDLVLVVDASASMGATDVAPDRLTVGKAKAEEALHDLPSGGKVSVIAAGRTARVVANGTADIGRVRQAIEAISVEPAVGDMPDALRLASALAARSGDAEVLIVTDAAMSTPPTVTVDAPVKVIQVGRERRNQAIVALAVRSSPSSVTRSVFISVANLDLVKADRRVELWGDGRLLEAREVYIDPVARAEVSIDDLPRDIGVVEVRLTGDGAAATDELAADDRAWAIVPPDRLRRVLLVSEGDPYLQTALSYMPNTDLYGVKPAEFGPGTHTELFDLIIFEGALPDRLPTTPILAIAPAATSPLGIVGGTLSRPGIGRLAPDEPLLRYVDLSRTHISEARQLTLPDWARMVIPGPQGAPLLYVGNRAGLPTAVLAFDPRRSDLPLQVAFPILLSNLAGELTGGSSVPAEAVAPGAAVQLPIPAGATGLRIARPDGTTVDLAPGVVGATSLTFGGTDTLGVYTVTPIGVQPSPSASSRATSGAGSGAPSPSATPTLSAPSPSPAGSGRPSPPPVDPNAPVRFAVDLFDVGESNIAPGSASVLEALGRPAGGAPAGSPGTSGSPGPGGSPVASASPGGSGAPGGAAAASQGRPPARDELWTPIVLAILAFLLVEWTIYQRDALARLRRSLGTRIALRRSPPTGRGGGG